MMGDFEQKVAALTDAIPDGKVATYGLIAALCGCPRHARHVGRALSQGVSRRAYQVIGSSGKLTGAASFLQPGLQAELLRASGVWVSEKETVDLKRYLWQPTAEDVAEILKNIAKE